MAAHGEAVLDHARTRLVIPSFEGRFGESFLYKTPNHPDYQKDRHKKFTHVALHTTAAPSYYPGVEDDGYVMIDGGVWANNPVMDARLFSDGTCPVQERPWSGLSACRQE